MLNQVLRLYNLPLGFLGLIKLRVPSLLMVATESRKDSCFCMVVVSVIVYFLMPAESGFAAAPESGLAATESETALAGFSTQNSPC